MRSLVDGIHSSQWTLPTPCPEWDVRSLVGHLLATVRRPALVAEGADPEAVPIVVTGVEDRDWAAAFVVAEKETFAAWSDAALLDASVRVPWGVVTGRDALFGYLNEALVHGWDLAVATGQPGEADPSVATLALTGVRSKIPAGRRGGPSPFGAVVEPSADAGPTERLANWSGHHRPGAQSSSGIRIQQAT